jgi:hypothetical protein
VGWAALTAAVFIEYASARRAVRIDLTIALVIAGAMQIPLA